VGEHSSLTGTDLNRKQTTRRGHSSKSARLVAGFFFLALFLDYYGGFGIKYIAFGISVLWVLQHPGTARALRSIRADLVVLLVIPILLIAFHLIDNVLLSVKNVTFTTYLNRSYSTISSSLLIVLYPLFSTVGSSYIWKQITLGFRFVAVVVILVYSLNVVGVINVDRFNSFASRYRIGLFGPDPRMEEQFVPQNQKVVSIPFVAYPMVLALGHEAISSPLFASLLFLGLIVTGERGLILGGILLVILTLALTKGISVRKSLKRIAAVAALLLIVVVFSQPIRYRITGIFLKRAAELVGVQDASTLIRLGHIEGYANLLSAHPYMAIIGAGPMGEIYNPFLHSEIKVTEMSILNNALYFGIPFMFLYIFWLYRSIFRLWRLRHRVGFRASDIAMLMGAAIFWLAGNTNPLMNSPFSIIMFMLLTLRFSEIRRSSGKLNNPAASN